MRGIAFFAVLAAALTTAAVAAQPHHSSHTAATAHAATHKIVRDDVAPPAGNGRVAPADEYFGRLKMSVLGIRNELNHLQSQVAATPDKSESVMGTASLVEDAIHDWERHYPKDPWLAKNVYLLTHVYAGVRSDNGHAHATQSLHWLTSHYQWAGYSNRATKEVGAYAVPASQAPSQPQTH